LGKRQQSREGNGKMIRSLKAAFGLSVLVALLVSAVNVMSASAITSGHFYSESISSGKTIVDITENTGTSHTVKLNAIGTSVECHSVSYSKPHFTTTTQEITVVPTYANCTQGGNAATVTMNGCHYIFTSRTPPGHTTAHLRCPTGKRAEVHTSAGTLSFGEQTPTGGGITYNTITANTVHALTAVITVEGVHYTCHGACQIFGTSGTTATLTGSVTVEGTDTDEPNTYVGITHT
jgi:hypothetical protein